MGQYLPCFKAYDVRGKVPSELNEELAYRIGRAYAAEVRPSRVCIGYDIRLSGPGFSDALARGLNEGGADVIDLGMVGTEMVYFATAHYGYEGGIMITASHNPPEYNGMKMVRAKSRPISGDSGLGEIERRAAQEDYGAPATRTGSVVKQDVYDDFVDHLKTFADLDTMKPFKVLADPGNGAAGIALEKLAKFLPLQIEKMRYEADGHFPNGVPNPILPEARAVTEARLKQGGLDFGVAWDGDYDRCFFLDHEGQFIEGYYIVGVLAQAILTKDPNQTIIYDPRLTWNTLDIVSRLGGKAVVCKSGHAFIKEKMRAEDAVYGGEMSAHHYFRGHWYCDSGMIPFLMICDLLSKSGQSLGELVGTMMERFPCSGEINSTVPDVKTVLADVEAAYPGGEVSKIDGLSIDFPEWRFNLRGSNTEPVIRLNVESRGNKALMEEKTEELLARIRK
ncbi:MAG: phosphomannomutase [Armatimonadetes bacterium]|nr:phosphomannomutase [Armatimonadota bacterium]